MYNDLESQMGNGPQNNQYQNPPQNETIPLTSSNEFQKNLTFDDFNTRKGFIRKVYGILSVQLLITVFLCMVAMSSTSYFHFMMNSGGMALMIIAIILTIIISIMLICCRSMSREVPTNYILLGIFTICEGYLVSYSCAMTSPKIVFMAAIMTLVITVSLTVYAMTTEKDFTYYGGMLFVCSVALFFVGIFMMFTNNPILHIIFAGFGVCLYGLYLIYDTQLIVGKKTHELTVDDYILGALFIYLDVVMIFLYVLEILSDLTKS